MHAKLFCSTRTASGWPLAAAAALLLLGAPGARAEIDGTPGSVFTLTASAGRVSTPDGASIYSWGYGLGSGPMQYTGPTLIVDQGLPVTVTLNNSLPAAAGPVSIVFQGQDATATGGAPGLITREAPPGGTVTYSFTPSQPGTYLYSSGTRADLQVEMGLAGALIVRPAAVGFAYNNPNTGFDRENLYVLSEIDLDIHQAVENQLNAGATSIAVSTSPYDPEYWLINGRCAPDTMAASGTATLEHQPYNALTSMYPGERLLLRIVGVGRQMHPFHTHGNHVRVLAQDGQLIAKPDGTLMGPLVFTVTSMPGATTDGIFEWTGEGLNWDIYGAPHVNDPGNTCNGSSNPAALPVSARFDPVTKEYCPDHGKAIPVQLPELQQLTYGGFWSGSPYLGVLGSLPPGEGGLNPTAGYTYMWHSHTEREIINNDIFPGGMMTMLLIEARPPAGH